MPAHGLLLLLALLPALLTGCGGAEEDAEDGPGALGEGETSSVDLFFLGPGGSLEPERREIAWGEEPALQVRSVVEALLAGPEAGHLEAPLPEGVELAGVYLAGEVAYLDLVSQELSSPPSSGSLLEMLRVYSLVNSVTGAVPEARRVVLLWNGVQRESFAGHLDTSHPLEPSPDLVATR